MNELYNNFEVSAPFLNNYLIKKYLIEINNSNKYEILPKIPIDDIIFLTSEISLYLKIRSNNLKLLIEIIEYFNNIKEIKKIFLKYLKIFCLKKCPILIYHLIKINIFDFKNDILPNKITEISRLVFYPFYLEYSPKKVFFSNKLYFYYKKFNYLINNNIEKFEELINYGWAKGSIEYIIKYDEIELFKDFILKNPLISKEKIIWSPFELKKKPINLDYYSLFGIFGSLNCFKYLLINLSENFNFLKYDLISSGNLEMISLYKIEPSQYISSLINSNYFKYENLIEYYLQYFNNLNELNVSEVFSTNNLKFIFLKFFKGDFNKIDFFDNTSLHYSTEFNNTNLVKYLLENGANPNIEDTFLDTPIIDALYNQNLSIIKLLIQNKANLQIQTFLNDDSSVLHISTKLNNLDLIKVFINLNIDINLLDSKKRTILDIAKKKNFSEIIEFLTNFQSNDKKII